jgi:hypothetical protein
MALPIQGDDNGIGFGAEGTSVAAVGVKGIGGKRAVHSHPTPGAPKRAGVFGEHVEDGVGVLGVSGGGEGVSGISAGSSGVHGTSARADGVFGESPTFAGVHGVGGRRPTHQAIQPSGKRAGVCGQHTEDGPGVLGESSRGPGVHGVCLGGNSGVRAENTGSGLAVDATSKTNTAVSGRVNSIITNQAGVFGSCDGSKGIGVRGESRNGRGVYGEGLADFALLDVEARRRGVRSVEFDPVGVWGFSDNGAGVRGASQIGFAGQFLGDVQVTGSISKAVSNFSIDHPLDPANKRLVHAAVESSDMKNIYDGTVTLNRKGEAEIRLPAWFGSLNKDFRYQLTAVGRAAPDLHIAQEFRKNRFRVGGGRSGMKVCWQVTGIRKDRWARAHPLLVEPKKEGDQRGRFLHPDLVGKGRTSAVAESRQPR